MKEFNLIEHIKGNDTSKVVFLFNIGIEKYWFSDVPTITNNREDIVVNHLEEMMFMIAKSQDIVILRNSPRKEYVDYLIEHGYQIPKILCAALQDESKSVTELIMNDDVIISELKNISEVEQLYFVPYGVSQIEESFAKKCDLELIGGPSHICKKLSNKVFAREITEELGLRVTKGFVCNTIDGVLEKAEQLLSEEGKIIIKNPTGASGKGLWIIDSEQKLKIVSLVLKRLYTNNNSPDKWLVEKWENKKKDLNIQVYISKSGHINVFSIKEQLLDGTVYIGSLFPPDISSALIKQCEECGKQIGKKAFELGYNGILGIDSIITDNNELIPVIEINARFTLSTYMFFHNKKQLVFYKKVNLQKDYQEILTIVENEAFCYLAASIDREIVGDSGRGFFNLEANDTSELLQLYKSFSNKLEEL